jgi:hypothetical protein
MLQNLLRIEILLIIFAIFIIIFTFLYAFKLKFIDSLYTSVSFQTFIGTNIPENDNYLKSISIIQMILSYILFAIILYNFLS